MEKEEQRKEYPLVKKSSSRPYEDAAYFYIQSRSRKAWATYVSEKREGNGYLYDNTSLRVKTYYTAEILEKLDTVSERPHLGVPTTFVIVDDKKDLKKARKGYASAFERLGSVYFRNPFKTEDLLLAVGYFEEEAFTHLVRNPCEGVRIEIFVDIPQEANEIVYLIEVVRD